MFGHLFVQSLSVIPHFLQCMIFVVFFLLFVFYFFSLVIKFLLAVSFLMWPIVMPAFSPIHPIILQQQCFRRRRWCCCCFVVFLPTIPWFFPTLDCISLLFQFVFSWLFHCIAFHVMWLVMRDLLQNQFQTNFLLQFLPFSPLVFFLRSKWFLNSLLNVNIWVTDVQHNYMQHIHTLTDSNTDTHEW